MIKIITEQNWLKGLTRKQIVHLLEMNMTTLASFKKVFASQEKKRTEHPEDPEPCWECRSIAKKFGIKE